MKTTWNILIVALILLLMTGCTAEVLPVSSPDADDTGSLPTPSPDTNGSPPLNGEVVVLGEPVTSYEVTFPDRNLELAVRNATGKSDGTLYSTDVAPITQLHFPLGGISDLTGIEQCINLGEITLSGNQVTDLSPLTNLSGRLIRVYSDGELLYEYTELRIFMTHNDITELPDLSKMSAVDEITLDLSNNKIEDISPLADLPNLVALYLHRNRISDISPVEGLTNLGCLDLWGNNISVISPVGKLTKLVILNLEDNQVEDISALADLTNLNTLILASNKIKDVSPLSGLTRLSRLDLRNNLISNASPLEALKDTVILLEGNPLE